MRKILPAILLAITLAGCAGSGQIVNSPSNPITKARLANAEESFNAAQRIIMKYRALRPCRASESAFNGCRKYAVYQNLRRLNAAVNRAFEVAEQCVRDSSTNVDCVAGVEDAVGSLISAAISTGVKP